MNDVEATPLRLLLVEDEPTQLLLMQRLLGRAGYTVETAGDGETALAKLSSGAFQMLVTDWDMPGMDGVTLCRRVREAQLPGYLYVLLLTGHGSTESLVEGLEAGADDYIRKPPNEAELLARLTAGRRIVRLEQSLREANAKIQLLSITDPLVGTFNRRYLNDQLVHEVERAQRYGRPLAAVMADLDFFKNVNDRHGHQVGDEVLRGFVELAQACIRHASDWMARYGGEEFVVVLPETDLAGAAATAEKIRGACAATPIRTSIGDVRVTASFGVAELDLCAAVGVPSSSAAAEILLREADAALYRSKHDGRNRITVAGASAEL
ncbi:MAG TPA: diguanylate cyclase [Steroidobacteraceae bacterium]|nr:diguanylate cyclase [Steroidobacteraceae bacterium]